MYKVFFYGTLCFKTHILIIIESSIEKDIFLYVIQHFLLFHSDFVAKFFTSGYDFAYLLKVVTAQNLPSEESVFFDLLKIYFPNIYDVKYLMKSCKSLKGGLQEVAELLEVKL